MSSYRTTQALAFHFVDRFVSQNAVRNVGRLSRHGRSILASEEDGLGNSVYISVFKDEPSPLANLHTFLSSRMSRLHEHGLSLFRELLD